MLLDITLVKGRLTACGLPESYLKCRTDPLLNGLVIIVVGGGPPLHGAFDKRTPISIMFEEIGYHPC